MRIINGFNFHPHKLEWYLERNELNEFICNTLIDISEDYKWFNGKGVWVHEELRVKKIFDDAYLMCTQVVSSSNIRLNFQKNFSRIPSQMGIPRLINSGSDARFDELLYSTWIAYLLLYYESKFYDPNDKAYGNVSYYLEKMMKIDYEVYDDDSFRAWKAKADEFIEKNKALDEPYRYDFKPGMVNPNFTGSEPWEKWSDGFNTDIIEELAEGDDHIAIDILRRIREAWLKYDKETADAPKVEYYPDLYFFDRLERGKLSGTKKAYVEPAPNELEQMAIAISKLDDRGRQITAVKEEEKTSASIGQNTFKANDEKITNLLLPFFFGDEEATKSFLKRIRSCSKDTAKTKYINTLAKDGNINTHQIRKDLYFILKSNNLYVKGYSNFCSQTDKWK